MSPSFERDVRESRIKKLFYINYKIKLKFTELDIYLGPIYSCNFPPTKSSEMYFEILKSRCSFSFGFVIVRGQRKINLSVGQADLKCHVTPWEKTFVITRVPSDWLLINHILVIDFNGELLDSKI